MVAATDRPMPAVAMTNVWPTDRTIRIAEATRIEEMLPADRKVGFAAPKTTTRTTRPTSAAHSAQKPTSLRRADQLGVRGAAASAATVVLGMWCSLRLARPH